MNNQNAMRKPFLHWMLFIFAALIGIETGAGSFTSIVVFPAWASSAEAARGWLPDMLYYMEEGDFFMYASTSTMLASILLLIAGWRAPQSLRKWILIGSIGFIFIFIWSAFYFIPVQDSTLKGTANAALSDAALESKLRTFVKLNYVRIAILYVCLYAGLRALRESGRLGI